MRSRPIDIRRVEKRAEVMGGELVFKNTRLPVRHIAKMRADGETSSNLMDDFGLAREDIELADAMLDTQ